MDENDDQGDKEYEEETVNNEERLGLEEEQDELEFSDEEFEFEEQDSSNEEDFIYSSGEEEEVEELGEFANGLTSNEETENEEVSAHLISDQESLSKKSGNDNMEMSSVPVVSETMSGLAVISEDICANMDLPDLPDIVTSATGLQKQDTLQLIEDQIVYETTTYPEPDLPDFPFSSSDNVQDEDFLSIMQMDAPSRFAEADRPDDSKDGDKVYKVSVKIERLSCKKPFLGGYRNKTTGQEYHNASSQTQPGMWNVESQVERSGLQLSHQTQTEEQEHLLMQTRNDKSTQMTGIGVYIPNIADRLIPPHKYVTADEYQSRLLQQVITIQKYYRHWLANVNVEALLARKKCLDELRNHKEQGTDLERKKRLEMEYERRLHPRTNQDFDLLFTYLETRHARKLLKKSSL